MQNPKIITMVLCPKQKTNRKPNLMSENTLDSKLKKEKDRRCPACTYPLFMQGDLMIYEHIFLFYYICIFSYQDNHEMQFLYRPMPVQYYYYLTVVYYEHCVDVMLQIYLKLHKSLAVSGYWLFVQLKLHTGVQNTAGK